MGSDFALLEIIFLAMLAGFLILRLRSVLGRRTDPSRSSVRAGGADALEAALQ